MGRSAALGVVLALASAAFASPAQALEQKLTAFDAASPDNFGAAVAVDGDTLVVGAPRKSNLTGAVYVFGRTGNTWTQTAKLTASDAAEFDNFGDSVAIDGDTIVVGASGDDIGASGVGSVYAFTRTGAPGRTETAKLTASDGAIFDSLGSSVAIDGDTIVAGSLGPFSGAPRQAGAVYTFSRTGAAARTETAKLTASDRAEGDNLGYSVAVDGDTIVAGASRDDNGGVTDRGSVYTFSRTGAATRTETAKLTASDGADSSFLGFSVAIEGDTIVSGAPSQNSAYSFARTGEAARTETAKLTASDGASGDDFGYSIAIDGQTIVVGAPRDGIGANAVQGSAYKFARTGAAARTETGKLTAFDGAAGDRFGHAVAIHGNTTVVGAPEDEPFDVGENANRGSASVFTAIPDSDSDGVPDATDSCPTGAASGLDTDGDGCKNDAEDADDDNDTITDTSDACPTGASAGLDTDGDGCKNTNEDADDDNDTVGDTTDDCALGASAGTDTDGDGCKNEGEDADDDGDMVDDGADACPVGARLGPDSDGDGCKNAGEDSDDDNDTLEDSADACPTGAAAGLDTDGDGCKNSEDADDDNDTVGDATDACAVGVSSGLDTDGDGCKNAGEDSDDDNDTVSDLADGCALGASAGPDSDGDGCKDAGEDADDDNDGIGDGSDTCPTLAGPSSNGGCPVDTTAPQTTIDEEKVDQRRHSVRLKFSSSEPGSKFRCTLDDKPFKVCQSPQHYYNLYGKHTFKVYATDRAGNRDQTPAVAEFRINR
jgi:hypothetical protein